MPLTILLLAEPELTFAIAFVGYDSFRAAPTQAVSQGGAVVGFVAQHPSRWLYLLDQVLGRGTIVRLAAGEQNAQKTAFSIADCMDLRVASATRTADCLILLPPFPPEAERWALT